MELDSVRIEAADVEEVARDYEVLLGVAPIAAPGGEWRFRLRHGTVELSEGAGGLCGIVFAAEAEADVRLAAESDFNGLHVRVAHSQNERAPETLPIAIDHVVVHSPDLERAIALWRDRLGIRLALDREFAQRGLRMLFFRSGGMTLEYVGTLAPVPDKSTPDRLYGMAYAVTDLENRRSRLLADGFDVSEIRPGQKTGTVVATVRSRTAGVPTLLIGAG